MRLHIRIVGMRPLLMHSPQTMLEEVWKSKTEIKKRQAAWKQNPMLEAEASVYRDEQGYPCIPARCILAAVVQAAKTGGRVEGSGLEVSRFDIPIKERIKGSIIVEPQNPRVLDPDTNEPIKKSNEKLNVDTDILLAKVKIGKSSIINVRAKFDKWAAEFDLVWNPTLFDLAPADVKTAVELSGKLGILDWRPTHGIYSIEKVEESE